MWKESEGGIIEYEIMDNVVFIEWIEVRVRMRGYGSKLYREFEEEMKLKGIKKVCIESYRGNEYFWENLGFKYVCEEGVRIESSIGYCMEKDI